VPQREEQGFAAEVSIISRLLSRVDSWKEERFEKRIDPPARSNEGCSAIEGRVKAKGLVGGESTGAGDIEGEMLLPTAYGIGDISGMAEMVT